MVSRHSLTSAIPPPNYGRMTSEPSFLWSRFFDSNAKLGNYYGKLGLIFGFRTDSPRDAGPTSA